MRSIRCCGTGLIDAVRGVSNVDGDFVSAAAVSSREAACCSVRRERSSVLPLISRQPLSIDVVACATAESVSASWATASLKSFRRVSNSSANGCPRRIVNYPLQVLPSPPASVAVACVIASERASSSFARAALSASVVDCCSFASASNFTAAIALARNTSTAPAIEPSSSRRSIAECRWTCPLPPAFA